MIQRAQGMEGGDFPCGEVTAIPGICAFGSLLSAALACSNALSDTCRAVVFYSEGLDGCSAPVAVAKTTALAPANGFSGPSVFVMEREEGAPVRRCRGVATQHRGVPLTQSRRRCVPAAAWLHTAVRGPQQLCSPNTLLISPPLPPLQTGSFFLPSETTVEVAEGVAALANDTAALAAAVAPNSTQWLGCITTAGPGVLDGEVVATLDGMATAEACCRCARGGPRRLRTQAPALGGASRAHSAGCDSSANSLAAGAGAGRAAAEGGLAPCGIGAGNRKAAGKQAVVATLELLCGIACMHAPPACA